MDMFFNFAWERIVARILCGEEGGTTSQAKVLSCLTGVSRVADLQGDCVKLGIMQSIIHGKFSQ
jgi:hypothetical protein